MARQTREQLGVKAGDKIIVKGVVSFARIDKVVSGEALVRENERRKKNGMLPTKEFRSITIEDPQIVKGQGTPLAMYYGQTLYQAKSGKQAMSVESKSLYAPSFGHIKNGTVVEIADPQKNPAPGQVVYLMITAFAAKGFSNLGSTFDAIIYEEGPIKFYEGSASSLSGFGAAMNMPVETLPQNEQAPAAEAPASTQGGFGSAPAGAGAGFGAAPVNTGFGTPQGAPASAPSDPFGVQDGQLNGAAANSGQPSSNPFA